jgi:hypothetical protein
MSPDIDRIDAGIVGTAAVSTIDVTRYGSHWREHRPRCHRVHDRCHPISIVLTRTAFALPPHPRLMSPDIDRIGVATGRAYGATRLISPPVDPA